jgi:Integrase core domain
VLRGLAQSVQAQILLGVQQRCRQDVRTYLHQLRILCPHLRSTPMELWQLDVTASAFLTDGTEVKIVTGIDDHSRFCVLAKAVMRATARPVCLAFVDAMRIYGIPEEVLTDNAKVFTGRFHKPGVPVEVLFDKICRENGITHRLDEDSLSGHDGEDRAAASDPAARAARCAWAVCEHRGAAGGAGCLAPGIQH